MTNDIHIQVLLFGACREAAETEELRLSLAPDGRADVAAAFNDLTQRFPQLAAFERSIMFAVNEEHARRDQQLRDGDTLAVFPPVSGG